MITAVNYIAQNNTIIEGMYNDERFQIKFSDIVPFWDYATEDDFEGGVAKVVDDKILFTMLTASMQGGIVVVWDVVPKKVVHISEGSYCVAVDMHDDKIYTLHCISNYVTKAHFQINEVAYGIKDITNEGKVLHMDIPDIADEFTGNFSDISLKASTESIEMILGNKKHILSL